MTTQIALKLQSVVSHVFEVVLFAWEGVGGGRIRQFQMVRMPVDGIYNFQGRKKRKINNFDRGG